MKYRQSHALETLRQVQVFLDADAAAVGAAVASSRHDLDDVVVQLATFATAQEDGNISSRRETAKQRVLRNAIRRDHMRPIADFPKQKFRDVPEFHALVVLATNPTSAQLVARARAMADAAQVHQRVVKVVGLSDDFVGSLRSLARQVSQSIDDRKQHARKGSGATASRPPMLPDFAQRRAVGINC